MLPSRSWTKTASSIPSNRACAHVVGTGSDVGAVVSMRPAFTNGSPLDRWNRAILSSERGPVLQCREDHGGEECSMAESMPPGRDDLVRQARQHLESLRAA